MPSPPSRVRRLRYRAKALPRSPLAMDQLVLLAGALKQVGWTASAAAKAPVDGHGEPLPWLTYGAIEWLRPRLKTEHRVFEYGAGNSTKWFARRVSEVHAVEHNRAWVDRVRSDLPANATVEFAAAMGDGRRASLREDDRYHTAIERVPGPFDVVVIDGMSRLDCVAPAILNVTADGLIVFDNSERQSYEEGHDELAGAGFGRIDFAGLTPGGALFSCTSVYGRNLDAWSHGVPYPKPMTHDIARLR